MTWKSGRSGTSMYSIGRSIIGSSLAISRAISFRVLSVTSWPRIFRVVGAMPKKSQPPAVLRKAQTERIPSFNSPVVFFISNVRVSSPCIIVFTSSIVIILSSVIHLLYVHIVWYGQIICSYKKLICQDSIHKPICIIFWQKFHHTRNLHGVMTQLGFSTCYLSFSIPCKLQDTLL